MSAHSRAKGNAFERLVASKLREVFPATRRGLAQTRSGSECADLIGLPYHVECKHHKQVRIQAAFRQATKDTDGRPPIVVSRDNRGPILVTMALDMFLDLAEAKQALDSVSVTAARAAELEAETACKALREATGRLEPVDDDFDIQIGPPSKVVPVEDIEKLYPGTTQRAIEMLSDPRFRARFNGLTAEQARDLFDRGVDAAAEEMLVVRKTGTEE